MFPNEKYSSKYINHLIEILKNMKTRDAGWVLRELSLDSSFDRELLEYLCTSFYNPRFLYSEIAEGDLLIIIKKLPIEMVAYLFENYREYSNLIVTEYDKKKLGVPKDKIPDEKVVINKLISIVLELYEKRKISYNGILLLFYDVNCSPGFKINSSARIYLIKRVFAPNDILWLFISSPEDAGRDGIINIKYADFKSYSIQEMRFDAFGEYWGYISLKGIYGNAWVYLEIEKNIVVQDSIIITKDSASLLYIKEFYFYKKDNEFVGSGILKHRHISIKNGTKIRFSIICDTCSTPIYYNFCEISEGKIRINFSLSKFSNHSFSRFKIQIIHETETLFLLISPTLLENYPINFERLLSRQSGEKIEITGRFTYGQRYFFFLSIDKNFLTDLVSNLFGEWHTGSWRLYDKKACGFDLSVERGEINLLKEVDKSFRIVVLTCLNNEGKLYIMPEGMENISNIYISLYKYENGWDYIENYISPVEDRFQFFIDFNKFIEGEESRINIYSNASDEKINILAPRLTKLNSGKSELFLKYNENIELNYLGKIHNISPVYENIKFYKYFINKKSSNDRTDLIYEIEEKVWFSNELNPEIIIFRLYLINKRCMDLAFKISIFKKYIYLLSEFKDSNNHYFHKEVKDRVIYSKIIDYLVSKLFEKVTEAEVRIIMNKVIGENYSRNFERINDLDFDLTQFTYKYLQYEKGEINVISNDFTIYQILILLYSFHKKFGKDKFEILIKRKNNYRKIYSKGIRGVLEKLGFLKQKKIIHSKLYLKELSIKKVYELLNDGFFPLTIRDLFFSYLFIEADPKETGAYLDKFEYFSEQDELSVSIKLDKYKFYIGELSSIVIAQSGDRRQVIIEFPSFMEILENSGIFFKDNKITLEIGIEKIKVDFRAMRPGRGYINVYEIKAIGAISLNRIGLLEVIKK